MYWCCIFTDRPSLIKWHLVHVFSLFITKVFNWDFVPFLWFLLNVLCHIGFKGFHGKDPYGLFFFRMNLMKVFLKYISDIILKIGAKKRRGTLPFVHHILWKNRQYFFSSSIENILKEHRFFISFGNWYLFCCFDNWYPFCLCFDLFWLCTWLKRWEIPQFLPYCVM